MLSFLQIDLQIDPFIFCSIKIPIINLLDAEYYSPKIKHHPGELSQINEKLNPSLFRTLTRTGFPTAAFPDPVENSKMSFTYVLKYIFLYTNYTQD